MQQFVRKYPRDVRTDSTHLPSQGTSFFGLSGLLDSGYQASNAAVVYSNAYFNPPIYKTATVNASLVAATQANFPVYVDLSRLGIASLGEAQSVRVYSDFAKTTEYPREIVSATEMHVKVTSLTTTSKLFVEWDDERPDYAVAATYGRNAVWTGYNAVYHLDDLTDSTGNGHTLTNNGSVTFVAAKVGKGASIQTAGQYLSTADYLGFSATANISLTMLAQLPSEDTVDHDIWNMSFNGAGGANLRFLYEYNGGSRRVRAYRDPNSAFADVSGNIADNSWRYLACTWTNSASGLKMSVNAGTQSTGTSTGTTSNAITTQTTIGSTTQYSHTRPIVALMDEVRAANTILSTTWLTTEKNNLTNEASFWGTWSTATGGTVFTSTLTEVSTIADAVVKGYLKTVSETVTHADAIKKDSATSKAETLVASDSLFRQLARSLSETITNSDAIAAVKTYLKTLNETVTSADVLLRMASKSIAETIITSDLIIRQVSRTLVETVTNSDTLQAVKTYLKALLETVTHTDSLIRQAQKRFSETVTHADSMVRQLSRALTETITNSDTLAAVKTYLKTLLETVTQSDSLTRQLQRTFTEVVTATDTVIRQTSKAILNSLSITDTLQAVKTYLKSLIEVVTHTDAVAKQTTKPLTDSVTHTDSLSRQTVKVILNSLAIADALQAVKTYLKALLETVTSTDTVRKQTAKNTAETLTTADAVQKTTSKPRAEAITLTDTVLRLLPRVLGEAYSLTDSVARTVGKRLVETTSIIGSFVMGVVTTALIDPYCQAVSTLTRLISPFTSRSNPNTPQAKPYTDGTPVQERPPKDC